MANKYGFSPVENNTKNDSNKYGFSPINEEGKKELDSNILNRVPGAIGTVASDAWDIAKAIPGAAVKAYGEIPNDIDFLKESIPSAYRMIKDNPKLAAKNIGAGAAEFTGRVSRIPPALVDYLSHIGMIKPETASSFPRPFGEEELKSSMDRFVGSNGNEDKGGQLLRGAVRNADMVLGGAKLTSLANPLKLTNKALSKEIVNTGGRQIEKHTALYNHLWGEAEKTGFNQVPINEKLLSDKFSLLDKYKTPREIQSLEDFILTPTLENAQKAQSDMGIISRALYDKSKKGSLTSEERATYEAAEDAEKHIEINMFKNDKGEINQKLQKQYKHVSNSYRENVVPYKYDTHIQEFKDKDITAKQLINHLKGGGFRAKKGSAHPRLAIRELLPILGIGAGGYYGTSLLKDLLSRDISSGLGSDSNK